MENGSINAWERRATESEQAWQAFKLYRDGKGERSQAKVVSELGKSRTLIERWSKRHKWIDRVREYDRWQDNEQLKSLVKGQVKMRERHAKLAAAITNRLIQRIEQMTDAEIRQLKPLEVAALVRVATEVETKARAVDIPEDTAAPFEVVIHTYLPGQEPEPMKELLQWARQPN